MIGIDLSFLFPEETEQAAMFHVFGDYVDRPVFAAHPVELDQVRVLKFRHHFGLLDEVVLTHGALLHHLDRHVGGSPPLAPPHHPELAAAQLLSKGQLCGVDLPFAVGQACCWRFRPSRRVFKTARETTGVVGVVFYQFGDRWLAVFFTQEVSARVLFDVVVFHLGVGYLGEKSKSV